MLLTRFADHADDYDSVARIQKKYAQELVELALTYKESPKSICDLGCGTGSLGVELQKRLRDFQLSCCDTSAEMLTIAESKLGRANCRFSQSSLPPSNDYDLILANFSFQWYENLTEQLSHCIEKLAMGGVLAFSMPVEGTFPELQLAASEIGLTQVLPSYYSEQTLAHYSKKRGFTLGEISSVKDIFPDTISFLRELHLIGATLKSHHLPAGDLRKLIKIHDKKFTSAVEAKYRVWTALYIKG
jgi:malonyl-CoA O-methyltransferase